jgi:DNA processing protein
VTAVHPASQGGRGSAHRRTDVAARSRSEDGSACADCLRRTWLVAALADHLARSSATGAALDAALGLSDDELIDGLTSPGRRRDRLRRERERVDVGRLRADARAADLGMVCRHGAWYPARLRELAGPPAVLHVSDVRRARELVAEPVVAVVGSRRASSYGLEMGRTLGRGLSAAGVTVVSGMALGVDSAAHSGALESGGRTIAVLAGGADVPYPPGKRALHARLRAEALVVSELPPGFRARRWCFPARNRIIAGLARLTVVVEAAQRSGALITARLARELGREVGAVPGRATMRLATGANGLIADGAHLIAGAQDALDVACGVGARAAPRHGDGSALEPHLAQVLQAVERGRDTPAALATTREEARGALAALAELELRGYLRRVAGGRYELCA